MTTTEIARAPLAKFKLAPENARFGVDVPIADLLVSIPGQGDLIDALHCYEEDGFFLVYDGGRRLLALQDLDKGKKSKLPPALKAGIPYIIDATKDEARQRSAVTFVREAMQPADEFLMFKGLFDQGLDHKAIASACAVPTGRVRQLLRLYNVAPPIIEALRQRKLPLDVVEAFAMSADQARQLAVFEAVNARDGEVEAYDVRRMMREGSIDGKDPYARFVGFKAYREAGGTVMADLFRYNSYRERDEEDGDLPDEDDGEDVTWADGALLMSLAEAKIDAMLAEEKKFGWGHVEFVPREHRHEFARGLVQIPQKSKELEAYTPEDVARASAFLVMDYYGEVEWRRGYLDAKTSHQDGAAAPTSGGKPAKKRDPELYGYGNKGHFQMTHVATLATQVALVKDPAAAYDAMLSHLVWLSFGPDYGAGEGTASRLTASGYVNTPNDLTVEGMDEVDQLREQWAERLPSGRVAMSDYVAGLDPTEKAQLMALCFADTLHAAEAKTDELKPVRWRHLGWMAKRAGVKIADVWTPSAEFLDGASKPLLLANHKAVAPEGRQFHSPEKMKKGEVSGSLAMHAKEQGWVPKLLADLTDVADPETGLSRPVAPDQEDDDDFDDEEPTAAALALATGNSAPIGGEDEED